jgi:hypothetical protein
MDAFIAVIAGAVVSVVVEFVKRYFGTTEAGTLLALAVVSFAGAIAMGGLKSFGLWETFVQLAITAAGIFGLFVRHLPKSE